jgi:hypothetical protein
MNPDLKFLLLGIGVLLSILMFAWGMQSLICAVLDWIEDWAYRRKQ